MYSLLKVFLCLTLWAARRCPLGLQYQECISCCPATCSLERSCIDSKLACLDGCYCPEGDPSLSETCQTADFSLIGFCHVADALLVCWSTQVWSLRMEPAWHPLIVLASTAAPCTHLGKRCRRSATTGGRCVQWSLTSFDILFNQPHFQFWVLFFYY